MKKSYVVGIPQDDGSIIYWAGIFTEETISAAMVTMKFPEGFAVYELKKAKHRVERREVTKEIDDIVFE